MNKHVITAAAAFGAALALAACGGGSDDSKAAVPAAAASGAAATAATPQADTASGADLSGLDPCSLLTNDEVAPLVAQPTSSPIDAASDPREKTCRWEGGDTSQGVPPDMVLSVNNALNGVPVDQVKLSLQAEAKEHGKVVDGLGDFGIVKSTVAGQASVIAVKGPLLFTLDLSARGAENQQDAVAALAKTALGRLG